MHKIFWNFGIQTDPLIPARRPDSRQKKKITNQILNFAVTDNHRVKIREKEKKRQIFSSCKGTKKDMEHECEGDTNCNWCTWNDPQKCLKGLEELEIGELTENIQAKALLRSTRIPKRVQVT